MEQINNENIWRGLTNQYSLSKTLRFGLSLNYEKNYKNNKEKEHYTHKILETEIKFIYDKLKSELEDKKDFNEEELLERVKYCITEIEFFYNDWEKFFRRGDQIFIIKDYYKILAKKCLFDIPKETYDKKKKRYKKKIYPENSSLNSLPNKDKIISYWNKNLFYFQKLQKELEFEIQKSELALKNNLSNQKPNLVDFRKKSLAIFNIANEILKPLNDKSINFSNSIFIDDKNESNLKNFIKIYESRIKLEEDIEELKVLFKSYGGNSFYKKITLNPYTLEKKSENYDEQIKKIISNLKLISLFNDLKNKDNFEIRDYFLNKYKKIDLFKSSVENSNGKNKVRLFSLIQSIQLFKFKALKPIVKYELSKFIEKNYQDELNLNQNEIYSILNNIGENIEIGKEYNDQKETFDLNSYPIKLSFDYAWENLAKSKYYEVNFDKNQCSSYLKTNFDVDVENNSNFILFSKLSYLKEQLKNIDYNNDGNNREKNLKDYKERVNIILSELKYFKIKHFDKKSKEFKEGNIFSKKELEKLEISIDSWINLTDDERKNYKKNNSDIFKNYNTAKQKLGRKRGEQKNNIEKYKNLTQIFKTLSQDYGEIFSELRDKLREIYEINKVEDLGLIIEDINNDKHLFTVPKIKYKNLLEKLIKENKGELKVYYIKSLTSKTLNKIIKNKGAYKEFHNHICYKKLEKNKIKEDWDQYKNSTKLLSYVKYCLENSQMAKNQKWAEFNFDFSNCNTYEDIEK
ncbi:MAG: hypothetical protein LAT82_05645 [Nanoarchaeota archaeon]|nr:hypothetical protein [Nanoarchaeota archaeon]